MTPVAIASMAATMVTDDVTEMQSAEAESTESIWNSWELPLVIVAATAVIAAIFWLIWCVSTAVRDPLSTSRTMCCPPYFPHSEASNEANGTRRSSMALGRVNGLKNLGNTCYFNAVVQCLGQTTILKRNLNESPTTGDLTKQFIKLFNALGNESDSSLSPAYLHAQFCFKAPRFHGYQQHDSHEFLRNFLDELRKEETDRPALGPKHGRTPKVIDQIFGGHQITVYTCDRCRTPYHICESMLDLSLPVRIDRTDILTESSTVTFTSDDPYRKAVQKMMTPLSAPILNPSPGSNPIENIRTAKRLSINDSLGYFTRVEHIKDDYLCRYTDCPREHKERGSYPFLTSATKQTLIFNPPAILTIHLKRFELTSGRSRKVNDRVTFDELLDIGPYCSSRCMRNDSATQNLWYSLYGVVVHQSTILTSGHYIAFVKVREKEQEGFEKFLQKQYFDKDITEERLVEIMEQIRNHPTARWQGTNSKGVWYLVNDSRVSEVKLETVLRQEAYLLFYERLQHIPNSVMTMYL